MKRKKAILLIHGFAGNSSDFNELHNDIQVIDDFDVFTYTLPGHNEIVIKNVTYKDWIKASELQIEKIINYGYKEIYIIGHSMGGVITSYLASKYKEVKKLVLAAPSYEFFKFNNNKINFKEGIKFIPNIIKKYPLKKLLLRAFKSPLKTVKEFSNLVINYKTYIKEVSCPTLILWGNNDTTVPISGIDYVYDNIKSKSVELYIVDGINHCIFQNNRYIEIRNIIINFLSNKESINKKKYYI